MSLVLATIKGIKVTQEDDGRVHWGGGAAIDADGANGQNGKPFAYRVDNKGLDNFHNAGWPNDGWRNVLIDHGDGQPTSDGHGNWYSRTAYAWKGRPLPTRYVDAASVPYVVTNPLVRKHAVGVVLGCRARVSYRNKQVLAVVADVSGVGDIGELSIAAAEALGISSSPRSGGVNSAVTFEFWPGLPAEVNGETYDLQPA